MKNVTNNVLYDIQDSIWYSPWDNMHISLRHNVLDNVRYDVWDCTKELLQGDLV